MTISISKEFAYPLAAITSSFWLTAWQTVKVGRARKAAGIPYPQLYAEKAEARMSSAAYIFNCTQRAHQSTLENLPVMVAGTLITSVKRPRLGAAIFATFVLSRVAYTIGYSSGDPKRRVKPVKISSVASLCNKLASTYTALELIYEALWY